ncbi:probable histone-lysine N-methyltransferase CG1716 [Drosophila grimshawi]|uniref:[histone H3]-lysine(36) N-trimethyltransferase n=1 Tax=Drosophila grimshawi TaxID=7222 RepID=B4J2R7_DROGR|nr:probable histone-lysine N-methyltransferase CG1716 [Drosophila grimshawi]EDV96058.1 GH16034 [Drosophila grimshawi]
MEKLTTDANANAAPRKRPGRPPKATSTANQESDVIEEVDSPQPVEERSSSPTNRRRSTRKKITKFDVLDVLNKSRKTHKIQIEARIDSNAPITSIAGSAASDINRLVVARSTLPAASAPLVPILESFSKPKPTPSLIVAQVSSDKSQQQTTLIRKRGRPRKAALILASDPSTSVTAGADLQLESNDSNETSTSFNLIDDASNSSEQTLITPIEINDEDVITVLTSDEDSNSQIIFVDIETAKAAAEADEEINDQPNQTFKLIFPNAQQNHLETNTIEIEEPQQEELETQLITEELSEPPELWFEEIHKPEEQQQEEHQPEEELVQAQQQLENKTKQQIDIEVEGEKPKSNFIEVMQQVIEKRMAEKKQLEIQKLQREEQLQREAKLESEAKLEREALLLKEREMEQEKMLEKEKLEREKLQQEEKLKQEAKLEREKQLEKEKLEQEKKLEREKREREKLKQKEKLEREAMLEREKQLEKEKMEREKLKQEEKLEQEAKLERDKQLEKEKQMEKEKQLEKDKKLELEMMEQEKLELEMMEQEKQQQKEKLEREAELEKQKQTEAKQEMERKLEREAKLEQEKKLEREKKLELAEKLKIEAKLKREKKEKEKRLEIEKKLEQEEKQRREKKMEQAKKLEREEKLEKDKKLKQERKPEKEQNIEVLSSANSPAPLSPETLSSLLEESTDNTHIIASAAQLLAFKVESPKQTLREIELKSPVDLKCVVEKPVEDNTSKLELRIDATELNTTPASSACPIAKSKAELVMPQVNEQLLAEAKAIPLPKSESPEPQETISERLKRVLPAIEEKKDEKPSRSTPNMSFKECDALFKVLDKAHSKMLYEQKVKKKQRKANKKLTAAETSLAKLQLPKQSLRRNTISEEHHEEPTTPFSSSSSKAQSLEAAAESKPIHSSSKKSHVKKQSRKSGAGKQENNQDNNYSNELGNRSVSTTTNSELELPDQFDDIAKFIKDGEKLLERDYKQEDEQQQQQQVSAAGEDEFAQRVANLETPATTPSPSPANSSDDLASGVRRSHRIKQKPQGTKSSLGRGSSSSTQTPAISMEQQLAELAHIEASNEQFLRQEGLQTFQMLRDNYYRCARQVSRENAEMQCDCFVTGDEESLGQMRCCGDGCINRMLMIECGPLCTNGERCTNKRFQQHQGWPCRVFRTEKKGCGITAELQMPSGEFIMEYVGEVIDSEEFERRQHLYSEDRNRHYYFMALRSDSIIDATSKGNISRYINHSCDPNAETQKWTVNGELRIGFFSLKTIMPGEEITFDYQYQRYGRDAQRCYCESANCRGWIGNEPESDEGEQLDTETESESEELQLVEQEQKTKTPKVGKTKKQQKLPASRGKQRKEQQPKAKDREYKAGRWLRPTGGVRAPRKPDQEDPDVLEQLTLLSGSGLKNQLDTLRFSRCMVRAKLLETRLQLLGVLTRGELPCRRLFLDYHGLRLLHAWISESGSDKQLRLALLDALESLPIPNKTMLNDSRVYQSVQLWSNQLMETPPEVAAPAPEPDPDSEAVLARISALLLKWNGLPEIFRIPKRERIEQMKEHEREADRQQQLEESNSASAVLNSDRYRQDRFRRDTSSRYEKSKPPSRMSGNNTICTITTQPKEWQGVQESASGSKSDSRRRSDLDPRRATISKELRRSLFERKVAQDEAEKRVGSEDWREHELRCEYFGLDLNTDPKLLPYCQNTETNEWFNSENVPVPVPPRCGDISEPPSPKYGDDVEYKLPPGVEPLPLSWHFSLTPEGDIYYYNLRDRIPQWEPPNAEQRLQKLVDDDEPLELTEPDEAANLDDLVKIDIDYVGTLSEKSLRQYIEVKIKERREARRNRLVSVRVISPRREEDRVYNQQESRKYKENKEKIRRRKEIYRRTRTDANPAEQPASPAGDSLPIHSYLYSSDEETITESNLPPVDALVLNVPDVVQPSGSTETETPPSAKRKHANVEVHKKHRDSKRKTTTVRDSNEKFHFEISGHVAEFLRPFRQDTCHLGRITSDEDYKFLIKRLSLHITTKEMRYCEVTGNPLACTESVKHKSYEFIKQYMRKKGPVYKKPIDRPD